MIQIVKRSLLTMGLGAVLMTAVGIGLGEWAPVIGSPAAAGATAGAPPADPRGSAVPVSRIIHFRPAAATARSTRATARPVVLARPPAAIPLDAGWRYQPDPQDVGLAQSWGQGGAPPGGWTSVSIPHDFNPVVSSAGFAGRVGWYETTFPGPAITAGRGWRLAFEAVRRNATVFLNGLEVGSHHDPYAPFTVPAPSLLPHQTNTLIVRVDDYRGGGFPEDWWNWGGITGPVSLQPAGRTSVRDLGATPELGCRLRCGDLRVSATIANDLPIALRPRVVVRVTSPRGAVTTSSHGLGTLRAGQSADVSFPVRVAAPRLWSPSDPALYRVEVMTEVGSRVESDHTLSVGMRSVRVAGGTLYLNGHRLWLHGASIHEDAEGRGAALSDADIAEIVAELKSVGANVTRAHYQLSPRLLSALDRAGIMVWAQPPVDHADAKLASAAGRAQALALLRSTLIEDRNHPSVIVDSVGNELSVTPDSAPGTRAYLSRAIALSRRLNPLVPVALDVYGYTNLPAQRIYHRLDAIGISDYFGWGTGPAGHTISDFGQLEPYLRLQHQRYPAQALVASEYGAEAFYDGAATTKGTYEFQSAYVSRTAAALDRLPFMNGSIYWTLREFAVNPGWTGGATLPPGYTPDGVHHKGLIAYDGSPKPAFAIAQQMFAAQPPFVPRSPAIDRVVRQGQAAFCGSRWCADGPGGHLLP